MKLEELIQKRFTEREGLTNSLPSLEITRRYSARRLQRITRTGVQMFIIRGLYITMICRRMRSGRAQEHCLYRCYARTQRMRQRKI